ncbi:hypothetical protein predicted by Glimmer/Critica [Acetobacter senegalensis]|uniref:Uncharacterized protein n=1 Tax=Acetobacter senegalensis TaxID=446692 RepID=A0A0U5ER13_9PROT|nr:hypothetical protein predicted by Glimmer/Critica [Acetobacter senegalensis]
MAAQEPFGAAPIQFTGAPIFALPMLTLHWH